MATPTLLMDCVETRSQISPATRRLILAVDVHPADVDRVQYALMRLGREITADHDVRGWWSDFLNLSVSEGLRLAMSAGCEQ
jgi:hypothetical protein